MKIYCYHRVVCLAGWKPMGCKWGSHTCPEFGVWICISSRRAGTGAKALPWVGAAEGPQPIRAVPGTWSHPQDNCSFFRNRRELFPSQSFPICSDWRVEGSWAQQFCGRNSLAQNLSSSSSAHTAPEPRLKHLPLLLSPFLCQNCSSERAHPVPKLHLWLWF